MSSVLRCPGNRDCDGCWRRALPKSPPRFQPLQTKVKAKWFAVADREDQRTNDPFFQAEERSCRLPCRMSISGGSCHSCTLVWTYLLCFWVRPAVARLGPARRRRDGIGISFFRDEASAGAGPPACLSISRNSLMTSFRDCPRLTTMFSLYSSIGETGLGMNFGPVRKNVINSAQSC